MNKRYCSLWIHQLPKHASQQQRHITSSLHNANHQIFYIYASNGNYNLHTWILHKFPAHGTTTYKEVDDPNKSKKKITCKRLTGPPPKMRLYLARFWTMRSTSKSGWWSPVTFTSKGMSSVIARRHIGHLHGSSTELCCQTLSMHSAAIPINHKHVNRTHKLQWSQVTYISPFWKVFKTTKPTISLEQGREATWRRWRIYCQ